MNARHKHGFTLLELIVTIVISAIAMAALLPFLDRTFLRSFEPRAQLQEGLGIKTAMEELVARNTSTLENLRVFVGAENSTFQTLYTVQDNRYVTFALNNETTTVVSNNLLKITLRNARGETLTRLFTEPL